MYQNQGGSGSQQQRPLGKNMRNDEYLERQAEQNRMRRMQNEQSRERQDQRKIQEREAGFNVYISGANEKRVADARTREKYGVAFHAAGSSNAGAGASNSARTGNQQRSGSRGGKRQDSRGARRRWLAPQGDDQDPDMESTPVSDAKKSNYQNPFSIDESHGQSNASPFPGSGIPRPSNQPSSRRKQWGAGQEAQLPKAPKQDFIGANFLDSSTPDEVSRKDINMLQPPLSFVDSEEDDDHPLSRQPMDPPIIQAPMTEQKKSDDEEDDYSDSFEEVNQTVETAQNQIEDLLKTATEDQLNILKQSLGNWADVQRSAQNSAQKQSAQKSSTNQVLDYQKNLNTTIEDEDYIEEDFEEDNSDSPIEDTTGNDLDDKEEEKMEHERREQQRLTANNRIQSTRPANKLNRPISATYDLSSNQNRQQPQKSHSNLGYSGGSGQLGSQRAQQPHYSSKQSAVVLDKQAMLAAMEEENRKAIQSRRPAASATNNYKGPGVITGLPQQQQQYHHATSNLESIAEREKQNNQVTGGSNPFATKGRPISQMLPKRPSEKSKTMNQQSLPKMTERQNFVGQQQPQQQNLNNFGSSGNNLRVASQVNKTIQEHEMDESINFSRHELVDSELKASMLKSGTAHRQGLQEQVSDTVSIADLLGQIQKLEDTQRHQLYVVLKEMETSGDMSASNLQRGLQFFLTQAPQPVLQQQPIVQQQQQKKEQRIHNELVLRVLSTLGNPHVCGITELELFDDQAERIPLSASCIMVRNQGNGPKVVVDKLINGVKLTKDEKQMWLGYLPKPPSCLEILIRFDKMLKVGGMKIWNYNKGILDCTKGVFEVQILINDEIRWNGQLSPGKGQINIDYAKAIILKHDAESDFALPKEVIAAPQPAVEPTQSQQIQQTKPGGLTSAQSMKVLNQPDQSSNLVMDDPKTTEEQFRQYRSKLDLAQGAATLSKPVAGPIWLDQDPKPRQRESKRPSEFRGGWNGGSRHKDQKSNSRHHANGDDEDINDIVKGAVDSVNKAVMMSNSKRKEPRRPVLVDESLDSLDYFKVTNLGRFGNGGKDVNSTAKTNSRIIAVEEQKDPSSIIPKKQQQPQNEGDRQSSLHQSSRKPGGGPIIKGGALPEEFMLPSPARSIPSRKSKKEKESIDAFGNLRVDNPVDPSPFGYQHPQSSSRLAMAEPNDTQRVKQEANVKHNTFSNEQMQGTREVQAPSKILHDLNYMLDDDLDLNQSTQGSVVKVIPTLPYGKKLEINILETWGDMNYLGLTGIEIFDELGIPIDIHENQILAFPPDVNVLPGYGTDPRTIDKLVDGQNFTNDDLHVWLTPFTSGEDHQISINLGEFYRVSMIRIWNYNKSRIHSYRGAKLIQVELDDQTIFRGEIKKAPGNTKNPEDCCEIILFTEEDAILEMIDTNDWLNELDIAADDFDNTQRITEFQIQEGQLEDRPMTATKKFSATEMEEIQFQLQQQSKPTSLFDERPMTSAIVQSQRIGMPPPSQLAAVQEEEPAQSFKMDRMQQVKKSNQGLRGQCISLNITQSWGDLFYVGLNGLEVLDERGQPIPITVERGQMHNETGQRSKTNVSAEPRDMNSIPGHGSDHRTLEKLFNGKNNTSDDRNMWLIPFNQGEDHSIKIDLGEVRSISALKLYNYNKQAEDTLRGARQVIIRLDDALVTPKKGITLRVAPGTMNGIEDIGQIVKLPYMQGWTNEQIGPVRRSLDTQTNQVNFLQEYEPITMPIGFLFKINLYSTHGDLFYIGLNGIELYDQNGYDVCQTSRDQLKVYAHPGGVHTLDGMQDDIRHVTNLVDGQNRTASDNHIWLTPYKNTKGHSSANAPEKDTATKREPNSITMLFEQPIALSALRLWNYSKTPARGVNEFELEIDGHKIYRGFLTKAPEDGEGKDWSSVVLFQGDSRNADTLGRQICFNPGKVQNVLLMNERRQMNAQHQKAHVNEKFVFDEQLRPQTKAFFK